MRRSLITLLVVTSFSSCKNRSQENSDVSTLGQFLAGDKATQCGSSQKANSAQIRFHNSDIENKWISKSLNRLPIKLQEKIVEKFSFQLTSDTPCWLESRGLESCVTINTNEGKEFLLKIKANESSIRKHTLKNIGVVFSQTILPTESDGWHRVRRAFTAQLMDETQKKSSKWKNDQVYSSLYSKKVSIRTSTENYLTGHSIDSYFCTEKTRSAFEKNAPLAYRFFEKQILPALSHEKTATQSDVAPNTLRLNDDPSWPSKAVESTREFAYNTFNSFPGKMFIRNNFRTIVTGSQLTAGYLGARGLPYAKSGAAAVVGAAPAAALGASMAVAIGGPVLYAASDIVSAGNKARISSHERSLRNQQVREYISQKHSREQSQLNERSKKVAKYTQWLEVDYQKTQAYLTGQDPLSRPHRDAPAETWAKFYHNVETFNETKGSSMSLYTDTQLGKQSRQMKERFEERHITSINESDMSALKKSNKELEAQLEIPTLVPIHSPLILSGSSDNVTSPKGSQLNYSKTPAQ